MNPVIRRLACYQGYHGHWEQRDQFTNIVTKDFDRSCARPIVDPAKPRQQGTLDVHALRTIREARSSLVDDESEMSAGYHLSKEIKTAQ